MIARAPGKIVISGAYAVLEGAPAIVSAVDRYATADTEQVAAWVTPEVTAAIGDRAAPWFDAAPLRAADRKLGLGSSAAILVASLAALAAAEVGPNDDAALAARVFPAALAAHAKAQGGGSGIDVAASAFGGTRLAERTAAGLRTAPLALPAPLVIEIWAAGEPASTASLLAAVRALAARDPAGHRALMDAQADAARAAIAAVAAGSVGDLVAALGAQCRCLHALGQAAGVPIVTRATRKLDAAARTEQAAVLPAGAGGGDITLFVGPRPPSPALRAHLLATGHERLDLGLGARGVHLVAPPGA